MGLKNEANNKKTAEKDGKIMRWKISGTDKEGLLRMIDDICKKPFTGKPQFLVTAYSEFFLEAFYDPEFGKALDSADQILPDGVSITAAVDFSRSRSRIWWKDLVLGGKIGWKILHGEYTKRTIVGVKLVQSLLEAGKYRIFLLGGLPGLAEMLANRYGCGWEEGHKLQMTNSQITNTQINDRILNKIAKFKPDILLVAYGRYKQEKWIVANLDKIKAKVVMGVGSSFDELAGVGSWAVPCPEWVEKRGLKWLWRVTRNPKHLVRAFRAAVVFPWRVYTNQITNTQ